MLRLACKEISLYSEWSLKEAAFLQDVVDNDGDGEVAEGCSNKGGDDDAANGGDGKKRVRSDDKADGDGSDDNNNGGIDDDADDGGGKGNDDGRADGNDVFGTKDNDEVDNGDKQIESMAGDLTGCSRSLKIEMRLGLMQ